MSGLVFLYFNVFLDERYYTSVRFTSSQIRLSVCLSLVCRVWRAVGALYADGWTFRQYFCIT